MFTCFDQAGLEKLNGHLATRSFIKGAKLSADDAVAFAAIDASKVEGLPHVQRWLRNVASYTEEERSAFPGKAILVKISAPAEKKEEKDDLDLFGSDDEEDDEETKAEKARMEAEMAAKKKPKKVERSMIVLHIKPHDDEAPMAEIMEQIPDKVQMEGLEWGKGELQDVCYGVKRIAMPCVVVDDVCSVDELCEKVVETFEDFIQSCDIFAFNKMD